MLTCLLSGDMLLFINCEAKLAFISDLLARISQSLHTKKMFSFNLIALTYTKYTQEYVECVMSKEWLY